MDRANVASKPAPFGCLRNLRGHFPGENKHNEVTP
jgi:hypothetical protein